jgi:tetratricopeptide (TPR) repeat protein
MISWLLLGALFQLDPVASEREWRQEIVASPSAFAPLFNLGFLCFNTGRFAEAEPLLRRAAAVNPKDFNTHYVLGTVLQRLERRDEALRAWRRALALRPDHVRLMKVMSVEYAAGRYFTESAELARRVVQLEPADDQGWLLATKALAEAQQFDAALTLARQAYAKFPTNPRLAFEVAFLLHRQGRWADAAPPLEAAMQSDPNYEEPWYLYGDVLLKQEQPAKAVPFFEKAIALRPEYLPARLALARAFMSLEQWEPAKQQLAAAAQARPDDPQPPLLLSQVLFRLGDEAGARQAKEKSLLLRRANPAAQEALQNRAFRP